MSKIADRLRLYANKLEDALVAGEHAVGSVADCTSPVLRVGATRIDELELGATLWRELAEKYAQKHESMLPLFDAACKYIDAHRALESVIVTDVPLGDILDEEVKLVAARNGLHLAIDAVRTPPTKEQ